MHASLTTFGNCVWSWFSKSRGALGKASGEVLPCVVSIEFWSQLRALEEVDILQHCGVLYVSLC